MFSKNVLARPWTAAQTADVSGQPIIPTIYRFGTPRLSLFGTIAKFSTVTDETRDDLNVELFPANKKTSDFLTGLGND